MHNWTQPITNGNITGRGEQFRGEDYIEDCFIKVAKDLFHYNIELINMALVGGLEEYQLV